MSDLPPPVDPSAEPGDWLEIPEYFPDDDANTIVLIRKFRADGLAVRVRREMMGQIHECLGEGCLFLVLREDAARVAAILDILLYSGPRQGDTPTRCEACEAYVGRDERCPSCGLNRRQDLEDDPLAAWIEEHIGDA
ncbi:MAG: hypothetical protein R3F20_02185 [Planctomycetota bacterium]